MNIIWFIIIGIVAGWLAGKIMRGAGFGLLGDLVIGIIGALLGGFIFGQLGISAGGLLGSLITATVWCNRPAILNSSDQARLTSLRSERRPTSLFAICVISPSVRNR